MHRIFAALLALQVILVKAQQTPFDQIIQINTRAQSKFTIGEDGNTLPDLFEGDIVRTRSLEIDIANMEYAAKNKISKFDAIKNGAWRNGVIPYTFASSFNAKGRAVVRQAIADYSKYTCIKWVPRSSQRSYVTFFHGGGCYSMIGQQGGPQRISLAYGCLIKGIAIHEMMHCAGFYHEQSRLDRDRYIRIVWRNIPSRVQYNFKKYRYGQASTLGASYDKQSVMHYGNYAFSTNGQKTIVSLASSNERLGQRRGFSRIDIQQLNSYYKCRGTKPRPTRRPTTGNCKDGFIFCKSLTSYCSHSWVMKNCLKSCRRCPVRPKPRPKPKPRCVDKHRSCPAWARARYCTSRNAAYRRYMLGNCKKSCGRC